MSDENVKRKKRAAVSWVEQINALDPSQRDDREWHYVLLGKTIVRDWHSKSARVSELLEFLQLRRLTPGQGTLILRFVHPEQNGYASNPPTVVAVRPTVFRHLTQAFLRSRWAGVALCIRTDHPG
jgi:hypothetical protein